jgi:hypothetical protein
VNLQRHLGCPCFQHLLLLWGKWFTSWRRFSDDARNALHFPMLAPLRGLTAFVSQRRERIQIGSRKPQQQPACSFHFRYQRAHIFDVLLAPARRTIRHSIGGEVRQMVRLSGQALLDFGQSLGSHAIILAAGSAA